MDVIGAFGRDNTVGLLRVVDRIRRWAGSLVLDHSLDCGRSRVKSRPSQDLRDLASRLRAQLPSGLQLVSVTEVSSALPSLPSQVVAAQYEVLIESRDPPDATQLRLDRLLAAESIPRRRERPDGSRVYDLRPLIKELWIVGRRAEMWVIGMRLKAGGQGTGRPDEVMAALSMAEAVRGIERVRLLFSPA